MINLGPVASMLDLPSEVVACGPENEKSVKD